MSGAAPLLSVITPSRERAPLLLEKLAALKLQDLNPALFEWVICLDGGDEPSATALGKALSSGPPGFPVRITETATQVGPGVARNRAAELAGGRILLFSDDDCLPAPDCLRLHVEAQVEPAAWVGAIRFSDAAPGADWRPERVGWWNVNGANTSVPATSFRQAGGFPDYLDGYGGEDLGLGFLLMKEGLPIRALPAATVTHAGPATRRSEHPERWRQAGANAARLARRHPEMAGRLGVQGWQLLLKRLAVPFLGRRGRLEAAYLEGAATQRRKER